MDKKTLAAMIDHSGLKPFATEEKIRTLCAEAAENHFASVCVNPTNVELSARLLAGTGVKVCTVVGFPLGANTSETKAFETRDAIARGADEIDMVINIGALKSGNVDLVERDIRAVVEAADGKLVKVITENCYLTDEEKVAACQAAERAGADYVKTSTGFATGGATAEDVALMRRSVSPHIKIKAAGSIRTLADVQALVEAGSDRIGTSASLAILEEME